MDNTDMQIDEIQVSVLEQAKEIKLALVEKDYNKAFEITNQLINDLAGDLYIPNDEEGKTKELVYGDKSTN